MAPGSGAHAVMNLRALKGRAGRAAGAQHLAIAQQDFAVGADVEDERLLSCS